jgi:hypothetical protein
MDFQDVLIEINNGEFTRNFSNPLNVIGCQVMWLLYESPSNSAINRILTIRSNLGTPIMDLKEDYGNGKFFIAHPIDRNSDVPLMLTNYTDKWTSRFSSPTPINRLEFNSYINRATTLEITPTYPVVMLLRLYLDNSKQ